MFAFITQARNLYDGTCVKLILKLVHFDISPPKNTITNHYLSIFEGF